MLKKAVLFGLLGMLGLLGFYFVVLTFVSGWEFAKFQFFTYWYFIIGLAAGFGIQVGLYSYLKSHSEFISESGMLKPASQRGEQVQHDKNGRVVAVSGTTSTIAMISCCSHYLVNILPILGIAGFITLISQYQVQLFWVGLVANFLGIVYMLSRIQKVHSMVKT